MIIREEGPKRALLQALANPEASKILASTTLKPKSVMDSDQRVRDPPYLGV